MYPKISILMSVYNGESYLAQSIESILKQTFRDFEFIIIDDGSTDQSLFIINNYIKQDCRIKLIQNEENIGLTNSLNKGLELAEGEYIARQDADDISLPERLKKQMAFMDAHPNIGICGTWVKLIGNCIHRTWKYPTDNEKIKAWLLFNSAIAHPSVMMRKSLLTQAQLFYDISYKRSQDYELWVRATRYAELANIPEVLVLYRKHENQVGKVNFTDQKLTANRVRTLQLHQLGLIPTHEELEIHHSVSSLDFAPTDSFLDCADTWLQKLTTQNKLTSKYGYSTLSEAIGYRWFKVCTVSAELGFFAWKRFFQSPLSTLIKLSWPQKLQFGIQCSIKVKTNGFKKI